MTIYLFDSITKEYSGNLTIPDNSKLPANSTNIAIPSLNFDETCIFEGSEWKVISNYKNKIVYNKLTGKEVVYDKLGDLPDELTKIVCPNRDLYSWGGQDWIQDIEKYRKRDRLFRERELNSLQWLIFRHESELRLLEVGKIINTTLTKEQIIWLDEYFNAWRKFMDETWFIGKQYPTRPEFLGV